METLYYDEEGRCVHLCNVLGNVYSIYFPKEGEVYPLLVRGEVGRRIQKLVDFGELGYVIEFWGDGAISVDITIYRDIDCDIGRVGDFDFSGMKFLSRMESKVHFYHPVDFLRETRSVSLMETSDRYFLVLYEYYQLNNEPFGIGYFGEGRHYIEELMSKRLEVEIDYMKFKGRQKAAIEVRDLLVIERLRRLGKIDK
jgi:hypothetical protein